MEELNNFENLYSLEEPDYIEIGDENNFDEPDYVEIGDENNFDEPDYVEIDVNTSEYENIEDVVNFSEEPEYINTFYDENSSNVNNSPQTRCVSQGGPGGCGYTTPTPSCPCDGGQSTPCGCKSGQSTPCGCNTGEGGGAATTYVSIIFSVKICSTKTYNGYGLIIPGNDGWCSAITLTFTSGNTTDTIFTKNQDYNFTHISDGYYIYSAKTTEYKYYTSHKAGSFKGKFTLKTINGHVCGGTINLEKFSDAAYSNNAYPSMPSYTGNCPTISATALTYKFKFGYSGDTATTSNASNVLKMYRVGTSYCVSANGVSGKTKYNSFIKNVAYAQISGTTIKTRPLCFYIQTSAKTFTVGISRPGSKSKNAPYSDSSKLTKIATPPLSDYRLATFKSLVSGLGITSFAEKFYINDPNLVLTPNQWGNLTVNNTGYTAPTMFAPTLSSNDCCYQLDNIYLFDEYMYLDNKTDRTGTSYFGYTVNEVLNKYDNYDGFNPSSSSRIDNFTFYL
jgi:hypothetical protein